MRAKIFLATLGVTMLGLLGACAAPLMISGDGQSTLSLNLGPGPAVRAIPVTDGAARFLASDNASATLIVRTAGLPDLSYVFNPTAGSISVSVSLGPHTFVINTYDSAGHLLTTGSSTLDIKKGNNALSLTMAPTVTGVAGTPVLLAAGQVLYLNIPGTASIISSTCQLLTGAPTTKFWVCNAQGAWSGNGSLTSVFYTSTNPPPATFLIRVQNTGPYAGTITCN